MQSTYNSTSFSTEYLYFLQKEYILSEPLLSRSIFWQNFEKSFLYKRTNSLAFSLNKKSRTTFRVRNWNNFPANIFPATYNMSKSKLYAHRHYSIYAPSHNLFSQYQQNTLHVQIRIQNNRLEKEQIRSHFTSKIVERIA